jgi:hypothetical protein
MDVTEFATSIIPNFKERWEIYNMTPEELIGKTVISITYGFSSGPGQIMVVEKIVDNDIHLKSCDKSKILNHIDHLGWGCKFSERHNKFILYK